MKKLVPIANSADYRQVTGTFSITFSGIFLPMQIIFQGQTDHCRPKVKFPEEFNVTHCQPLVYGRESYQVNSKSPSTLCQK